MRPSRYARRITGQTPIAIGGPAAGHDLLRRPRRTPPARRCSGTLNNCAMGYTPWGTYLACEENFNGYFRKTAAPNAARGPVRHQRRRLRLPVAHHRHPLRRRRRAERAEPLRLGDRDQPVRSVDARRSSARRSAASSTRAPGSRRPATAASSSTWATTSGSSTSTATCSRLPWRQSFREGVNPLDDGTLYVAQVQRRRLPASGCR